MRAITPMTAPTQTSVLAKIGMVIVFCQTVERAMKTSLAVALPKSSIGTLSSLQFEEKLLETKTLGQVSKILHQRVELDDSFGEVLKAFVSQRNQLVHDVRSIDGWGLHQTQGLLKANAFLDNLMLNAEFVLKAFISLLISWQAQNERVPLPDNEQVRRYLGEEFDGIADHIFFAKSEDATTASGT